MKTAAITRWSASPAANTAMGRKVKYSIQMFGFRYKQTRKSLLSRLVVFLNMSNLQTALLSPAAEAAVHSTFLQKDYKSLAGTGSAGTEGTGGKPQPAPVGSQ